MPNPWASGRATPSGWRWATRSTATSSPSTSTRSRRASAGRWHGTHPSGAGTRCARSRRRARAGGSSGSHAAGRGVPRQGYKVFAGDREIGELTSGNYSPTLGHGIGLALGPAETRPQEGAKVEIEARGRRIEGDIVKPPFVKRRTEVRPIVNKSTSRRRRVGVDFVPHTPEDDREMLGRDRRADDRGALRVDPRERAARRTTGRTGVPERARAARSSRPAVARTRRAWPTSLLCGRRGLRPSPPAGRQGPRLPRLSSPPPTRLISPSFRRESSRPSSSSRPSCARSTGWRSPTRRSTTAPTRWSRRSTWPCARRSRNRVLVGDDGAPALRGGAPNLYLWFRPRHRAVEHGDDGGVHVVRASTPPTRLRSSLPIPNFFGRVEDVAGRGRDGSRCGRPCDRGHRSDGDGGARVSRGLWASMSRWARATLLATRCLSAVPTSDCSPPSSNTSARSPDA